MTNSSWDEILKDEYQKEYFKNIMNIIDKEYQEKTIYPKKENIFTSFKLTEYNKVKVVIIGQDPYHGENQAHGLSFSVENNIKLPPSLKNIFKELKTDLNIQRENGNLTDWAKQGILLLNSILTVEAEKPSSHKNYGWNIFTDKVIEILNDKQEPIIFILWGNFAKSKKKLITNDLHYIIESNHPSPLSASINKKKEGSFFGSKPFSKTNQFLEKNNKEKIKW